MKVKHCKYRGLAQGLCHNLGSQYTSLFFAKPPSLLIFMATTRQTKQSFYKEYCCYEHSGNVFDGVILQSQNNADQSSLLCSLQITRGEAALCPPAIVSSYWNYIMRNGYSAVYSQLPGHMDKDTIWIFPARILCLEGERFKDQRSHTLEKLWLQPSPVHSSLTCL